MTKATNNSAIRAAAKSEASKLLALVAPAAYGEAINAIAAAKAVVLALGKAKLTGPDGKPSARFEEVRLEYTIGYIAPRLPGCDNLSQDDRITKARAVVADAKRGEVANTIMASGRQSFCRALRREGISSPAANGGSANGKAKTGDETKAGQGATNKAPSSTVEVTREAAKALPPAKPDRENVVEYIRTGLAAMALCIEKANQSAAKSKGKAVPPQIQSEVADWIVTAKTWVI
jgi:hypothetical protein